MLLMRFNPPNSFSWVLYTSVSTSLYLLLGSKPIFLCYLPGAFLISRARRVIR